jgi:esterase/lipase
MDRIEVEIYNNNIKLNIISHTIDKTPSAILIHVHGLLDSFSDKNKEFYLFENRMKLLEPLNILSYGLELRGHGKSENINICNSTIDDYSDDLGVLIEYILKKHPDIKIHILSSSIGGLVSINYCVKNTNSNNIKSIILISPCIKLKKSIHNLFCNLNIKNIDFLSKLCNPIISLITNSDLIQKNNSTDKLNFIKNILNSINFINSNKDKFNIPAISMHSEFDLLTDSHSCELFMNNCYSKDKKIITFKKSFNHYLLKDIYLLNTIKKNIYDWLEQHI